MASKTAEKSVVRATREKVELTPEQQIREIRMLRAGKLYVEPIMIDTLLVQYDLARVLADGQQHTINRLQEENAALAVAANKYFEKLDADRERRKTKKAKPVAEVIPASEEPIS